MKCALLAESAKSDTILGSVLIRHVGHRKETYTKQQTANRYQLTSRS